MHAGALSDTLRTVPGLSAERLTLRLSPGILPLVIDGEPALFVEPAQELHALNGSAAILVARLIEGATLAALRREFADAGLVGTPLDGLLMQWCEQGILRVTADGLPDAPALCRVLPCGDDGIVIRFPDTPWGRALARPYDHLPRSLPAGPGGAETEVALHAVTDLVLIAAPDGGMLATRAGAAHALRSAVLAAVLAQGRCVALHAACLTVEDQAILLTGSPGAGKSTLAATCAAALPGCVLAADDIVLFDPHSGCICGVPLPLTAKRGSWDRLAETVPALLEGEAVLRGDGQWVRYAPLPAPVPQGWQKVRAVVDLDRRPGAETTLEPNGSIACLGKLMTEGFVRDGRCTGAIMRAMVAMVDTAGTFRLQYAEAQEAVPWVHHLVGP